MRFFIYDPTPYTLDQTEGYWVCDKLNRKPDSKFTHKKTARAECRMLNRQYYCRMLRRRMYKHGEWLFLLACIAAVIVAINLSHK
jgi:hypothetical protein